MSSFRKSLTATLHSKRLNALKEHSFYSCYVPIAAEGVIDKPKTLMQFLDSYLPMPLSLYYLWEWNSALNYAVKKGPPVVCWAESTDKAIIRNAATRLNKIFKASDFSPVIVTSVADFPFFILLGCLVEYLPVISGEVSYNQKKRLTLHCAIVKPFFFLLMRLYKIVKNAERF